MARNRNPAGTAAGAVVLLVLVSCASPHATAPPASPSATVPTPSPAPSPIITPSPSPSPEPAQRMEPPLPAPIEETAAAVSGGMLYVIGGFDVAGRSLSSVYVFDGSAWSSGPSLPVGLDHTAAATLADIVFVAGGHSGGADSARVFRLEGGVWQELAPMHHARGGHALIAAAGRLYAIGGNSSAANVAPSEVYDPQTNVWTDLAALPAPRNHVSGFVLDNQVCVAGGRFPTTARVDCFDYTTSSWVARPDLPRATSGAGAATLADGSVLVMGGQDAQESSIIGQLTRFSAAGQWSTGESMLAPRHGFELAMFKGRAWACGGGSRAGLDPVAICTSVR